MIIPQPPTMIHNTAKGPSKPAAFVSLKMATSTDVHRMQLNDAVRKKLIYWRNCKQVG